MMDQLTKEERSRNMAAIKSVDTKPEWIVRRLLFSLGYRYRLHDKKLPGKPDIVLPKYKTIIFIHGCFWHRHEGCRRANLPKSNRNYWLPKIERNVQRDADNETKLKKLGWKVITIWECQIKDSEWLKQHLRGVMMQD
jgi:DNA mismatch endonuclease, patch repair protein